MSTAQRIRGMIALGLPAPLPNCTPLHVNMDGLVAYAGQRYKVVGERKTPAVYAEAARAAQWLKMGRPGLVH